jgi:hypothetical protein
MRSLFETEFRQRLLTLNDGSGKTRDTGNLRNIISLQATEIERWIRKNYRCGSLFEREFPNGSAGMLFSRDKL